MLSLKLQTTHSVAAITVYNSFTNTVNMHQATLDPLCLISHCNVLFKCRVAFAAYIVTHMLHLLVILNLSCSLLYHLS